MKKKLVFATQNKHKLEEVRKIIPQGYMLLGLHDIGCVEAIEETALTLEGNADLKARYVYEKYGLDCFADDTGLEVKTLDGRPGVFSARYAGEEGNAEKNIYRLLTEMEGIRDRNARFRTVISLISNGNIKHFEGIAEGRIIEAARGKEGFGYDPVFVPDGYEHSFAEMPLELKNQISHRGKAIHKLVSYLAGTENT
jgi:XTP/dITP diphosphohydrolase